MDKEMEEEEMEEEEEEEEVCASVCEDSNLCSSAREIEEGGGAEGEMGG